MGRVGSRERIDDVQRSLRREVLDDLRAERLVAVLLKGMVDLAPPDSIARARLVDDELVLRRAAGELAGVDDEGAAVRQAPAPLFSAAV